MPLDRSRLASDPTEAYVPPEDLLVRLPTPFQIFRAITGSEHLHFGIFERPDEPLRDAQERMTAALLAWLPDDAEHAADVGCGIGGTSCRLAWAGLSIDAFAPDEHLMAYARALAAHCGVADRTRFTAVGLHEWEPARDAYDVVLSQESLQYIHPLDRTLARIRSVLRPGGRFVLGDQVILPKGLPYRTAVQFHPLDELLRLAEDNGLALRERLDVTETVKPTVTGSIAAIRARHDELVARFEPACPSIRKDLEVVLANGGDEVAWYRKGLLGYELFAFEAV